MFIRYRRAARNTQLSYKLESCGWRLGKETWIMERSLVRRVTSTYILLFSDVVTAKL